jgi:hypothetical protein
MNAPLEMNRAEWFALKRAARDLDVVKGGYWRVYRGGRIAFFCGSERPAPGVPAPKRKGPWPEPRALVGMAVASPLPGGWVLVRLEPWDEPSQDATRIWLARQFERLRDHAAGGLLDRVAETTQN